MDNKLSEKCKSVDIGPGGDAMLTDKTLSFSQKKQPSFLGEGSPTKPTEEAAQPDEDAMSKAGSESDIADSFRNTVSPLTVSSVAPSDILTEKVIAEETKMEKLDQREEEKEEAELQKRKELWLHMDNETKEMRYQRLQNLLAKSNMYTEYLLQRMDRQKEEERRKREQEEKKMKRLKEKEQKQQKAEVEEKQEVTPTVPKENVESQKSEVKLADEKSPPSSQGRPKMSLRAPVPKSQLSTPSTPVLSQSKSQPSTPKGDGDKDELKEDPVPSPQSEKENQVGPRRSTRGRKSAAPEQHDFEDCLREYLGESVIPLKPEVDKQTDDTEETPKRGRKRKNDASPEQAKQGTPLLTNFFMPGGKKRKVEEAAKATEAEQKKTDAQKTKEKKKKVEEPLPFGESVKDVEGNVVKPYLLSGGDLRQYQVEGLNWLRILFENGVNGILADEMGLGKTVQCIAALAEFILMGCPGPFIVVAPLSTLPNWKSEFQRFAPRIPTVFYHGSKDDRMHIRRKIHKKHTIIEGIAVQPVVLTSYEIAMRDRPHLQDYSWSYLIVDEGHRMKNSNCRLVRELKQYKNAHRLLLTGTPLQNNLSELWSLLNFLLPEIFDDLGSFETWFDVEVISDEAADEAIIREEKKKNILGMLHQILTPFMLRRVKTDVDLKIPPKKEILVYTPLSECQKVFYEATVDRTIMDKLNEKNKEEEEEVELTTLGRPKRFAAKKAVDYKAMIDSGKDDSDVESWVEAMIKNSTPVEKQEKKKTAIVRVKLQNIMMQLRRVCNHPYLLEYPLDAAGEYKVDEDLVTKCGKMMVLDKMLAELKKRGHKVLLFSQMTKMMDIIEDLLWLRGFQYCRLDGSTSVEDRRVAMDSFNKDPDMFVFLLSTKAGGLGINLVGGDTVIIYDSDWNPQNDLQAQDRCHRIGQTRPVMVYRLVTANTIDQKIVERAAAKRKLEKMVIKKGKFKSGISNFSREMQPINPEELMKLLKSKDYSGVVGKDSSSVISKKDLNALLDRSDMVEEYERIQKGLQVKSAEKEDGDLLRTSSKDSCKLFKTIDYDSGESTLANKDSGETTTHGSCHESSAEMET